jgi:serine/threonine protein kinase
MSAQLVVVAGPDKGRSFPLSDGQPLVVGRSQTTATRLNDPHVSRIHCQVLWDGARAQVTDANSAAGTLVNGKRVGEHVLRPGDVIQVGDTELRFQVGQADEHATLPPAAPAKAAGAAAPLPAERLGELVGQKLGYFEVRSVLAKGQTGMVFRAQDTKDEREVALKVLYPQVSQNEDEMQRFVRAMKTMLPLRHPNLVTLYGAGRTGPHCWISMEYVEGESLTAVIKRIGVAGMLDWRHALRVAVQIARALEYAHGQHVVHRAIAPPNILIRDADKVAKLADLMLAKALEGALAQQITRPGELVGEVAYMSPERAAGRTDIDERSDIYGLGAAVYALLTGRPPCQGANLAETVQKIRGEEPAPPKRFQMSIPDMFEGAVLRMLAKSPEKRYATAAELLADLERVAKFQGVTV